jgi:hypothetical protein
MLILEHAFRQLCKHGEEICGDRVEILQRPGNTIVVMSDGLGSGVKANILSSLTTKIISTMLREGCTIQDVAETLNKTLPVCKVRQVAYSTFTALQIDDAGQVVAAEYDNPQLMWFSGHKLRTIPRHELCYGDKMTVFESSFQLEENDWLVSLSDGVTHAGMGGQTWDLGWSWKRVAYFIKKKLPELANTADLCELLLRFCNHIYQDKPRDDTTVVAMHYRRPKRLAMIIGPPRNSAMDQVMIEQFLASEGRKVVCGGTTGKLVASYLGRAIDVRLETMSQDIPAIGVIDGIDLVTEGVLTLARVVEWLRSDVSASEIQERNDGVARLVGELLMADEIRIFLGQAINPAHQSPDTPVHLGLKFHFVAELQYLLSQRGKRLTVEKF